MIYILYILVGFAAVQFVVAVSNLLFQEKLSEKGLSQTGVERNDVSVLIPVRNEEKNIGSLLSDLLQAGDNFREIIVFDDESTDGTAEVVSKIASTDSRVHLLTSAGLPEGWLGKNHACHRLALEARGEFFLFLDADVRVKGDLIHRALTMAMHRRTALLSMFPAQQMLSIGEWLTVPLMNYILLTLLPLPLVLKSGFTSLAAANGQFMLFSRSSYLSTQPHSLFRDNKVEDISIARYFKTHKLPVVCITSDRTLSCRMYQSATEAVNGFSKNVLSFFGNSVVSAALFWLFTTLGIVAVMLAFPYPITLLFILIQIVTRLLVSVGSCQNGFMNILLAIPQQWMMGYMMLKALKFKHKKGLTWKGRTI